jgi:thymidylate synthase
MFISADSIDDALGGLLRRLLKSGRPTLSGKGRAKEFTGVQVRLSNPRARFSRTERRANLFSSLGETLWYLSGSDRLNYIEYYIPKYRQYINASRKAVRAPGAYGPRLFGGGDQSQINLLIKSLRTKLTVSDTRQAVAQIFSRKDLKPGNGDVPCTTTLQFLPRQRKLHLIVTMRSNDIYRGFPGDIFAFTFIQEIVARSLDIEVGTYSHFVGSLHFYDSDKASANGYLKEGFQIPGSMPEMPKGNPWVSIAWLIEAERAIRLAQPEPDPSGIDPYWLDLARLLRIKALHKKGDIRGLVQQKNEMDSPFYDSFIRNRQVKIKRQIGPQPELPGFSRTD